MKKRKREERGKEGAQGLTVLAFLIFE